MALVLGGLVAVLTPPGLPYDEPAHWSTVVYEAAQVRLPVVGDPGTTYEAQMGPGYYVPSALVLALVRGLTHQQVGFYAVRVGWLILIPLLGLLTRALARAAGLGPAASTTASAVIMLSPLMLMMAGSVQNDYLCIVVATATALVAVIHLRRDEGRATHHLLLGALAGLAVLVKPFAMGLLPAIVLAYAMDLRHPWGARVRRATWVCAGFAAVAAWWFLRNLAVYGDLTGRRGVAAAGYHFPSLLQSHVSITAWVESLVSYVFVPTEYDRNVVHAPPVLQVASVALAVTLALLAVTSVARAAARLMRRRELAPPDEVFMWAAVGMTVVGYTVATWTVQGVAPRLAFVVAPLAVVLLLRGSGSAGRLVLVMVVTFFVIVDVWVLAQVTGIPAGPYTITFA